MSTCKPFRFSTRLNLTELTGLRAATLTQLLDLLKSVPGSCIYHHTHRFLQQHQYLSPEPPNDFAYWVDAALGEKELGEQLASIDTVQFTRIRELRNEIIRVINEYLERFPRAKEKFADPGEEFHFLKSISFVIPTAFVANNLAEFRGMLGKITIDSVYFHVFEARLRLEKGSNDFSSWIEECVGDRQLAEEISGLDPYTFTMEELRNKLINIIGSRTG